MIRKMIRMSKLSDFTGESRSTTYLKIQEGTFPPPVKLGERSVGWPEDEVAAINSAKIAGNTTAEIKLIVDKIVADRKNAMKQDIIA